MAAIRHATTADAARCAELAEQKREQYKTRAPVFHRPKPGTREMHAEFLATLIDDEKKISLVSEAEDGHVEGFVIAFMTPAPPVYDPGGPTCHIDDFMVEDPDLWHSVGRELLDSTIRESLARGAVQTVVVCGPHDVPKRSMLLESGHVVASEWLTKAFHE